MPFRKSEVDQLRGVELYSQDGESVGTVDEIFLDRDTGAPEWAGIKKRGLIGTKWTPIPLAGVTLEGNEIRTPYSTAQIDNAPQVAGREITDPEEDALYAHYQLPRSTDRSGSGLPGGPPAEAGRTQMTRSGGEAPAKPGSASRSTSSSSRKKRAAYHVTPDEGGWKVVKEGEKQPVTTGRRKEDVIPRARRQAKKEEAQLIIHKKDGKIQEERTYGHDPASSRG
jgi:sporulation protein YlmC with PRC-barrel domain